VWRRIRWLPIVAVLAAVFGFALSVLDVIEPGEGIILALTGLVLAVLVSDSG
jgi:hypothetical protein